MKSKILPAGWQSFEVIEIGEPKKSSSGNSFNLWSSFRIIDDEKYEGKELEIAFNTSEKMKAPSTMGTMYLMPKHYLLHLAAATACIELDEVPEDLDTDSLKGLKFDGKVEKIISDGVAMNTISQFLPYGAGKEKEAEGSPF
jgi:hypothetical protein